MKKIYVTPNVKWETLDVEDLMQGSLPVSDETVTDQWSKEQIGDDESVIISRSVWEE